MAFAIQVSERTTTGGRTGKQIRRAGNIPAVLYGRDQSAVHLALEARLLDRAMKSETGRNTILQLESERKDIHGRLVMVRDMQVDRIKRRMLHADLIVVHEGELLRVVVPLVLEGRPIGLLKEGILQQIRRDLEIECLPTKIPSRISVDISALDLGHSLHVADLKLEEGIRPIFTANFTLATVIAPEREEVAVKVEAVEGAEAAATPAAGAKPEAGKPEAGKKEKTKEAPAKK